MAPRPNWKGYLKLSLVSCSVALYSATSTSQRVRFHIINRETGHRVRNLVIDAETEEPVEQADRVKGYEVEKGQYVLVEDDELDEVALESTHTIEVESFVPRDQVDEIYLDESYFIVPSDKVGYEAFAVIRDAMKKEGLVGLARVVLYRRERILMLQPRGKGLMATALRYNTEVRDEKDYFSDIPNIKVPADMLDLAIHILSSKKTHFDADKFEDRYDSALTDLIKAKHAGKPAPKPAAPRPSNVINLMDALKRSVKAEQGGGKSAPRAGGSHPRRARAASSHRRSSGHKARVKRAS
jgi:DNA end-binding protein Ku